MQRPRLGMRLGKRLGRTLGLWSRRATPQAALALLLIAGLPATAPARLNQEDPPSLEELLRRTREARDAAAASLQPQVAALLEQVLEAREGGDLRDEEKATEKILKMGAPAASALVPFLRPKKLASISENSRGALRAKLALELLREMPTPAVVPALEELTRSSSKVGAERAIRALGFQTAGGAPERRLLELFETPSSQWRGQALGALVQLGIPAGRAALGNALNSDRVDLIKPALEALTEIRAEDLRATLADYLARGDNAHLVATEATEYFLSLRDGLQPGEARHCLEFVLADRLKDKEAADLLDRFRGTDLTRGRRDLEDSLERLQGSISREIAEAASLCLARLGDRKAKSFVLERYDREISDADPDDSDPWADRAEIYLRMDEFAEAVSDYKKALKNAEGRPLSTRRPMLIGLARSYARQGKLSAAADSLEDALLGRTTKANLRLDPDFAELLGHPRHGEVLR